MSRGKKVNRRRERAQERKSPAKQALYDNTDPWLEELKRTGLIQGLLCDYVYRNNQYFSKTLDTDKETPIREKVLRKFIYAQINMKPDIKERHLSLRKSILEKRYGQS